MVAAHRIRLLGRLGVERDGAVVPITAPLKALALIGYLACQREPIARPYLAALLWGETTDFRSRRNLTHTLGQLADALPGCLDAGPQAVGWAAGAWADVHACAALLHPVAEDDPARLPAPRAERLEQAVGLYRGELLAGLALPGCSEFETWLVREREHWRQQMIAALTALVRHYAHQQRSDLAEPYARRLVELEPWHEEGHRALMLLLAYSGRRGEALASYERLQRTLAAELGVAPSEETQALYARIRSRGEAREIGTARPAPRAQRIDWGDAPPAGQIYGRVDEIAALSDLVLATRCRLVAVLGMGGIGKTRLAAHVARAHSADFAAVVWRSLLNAPPLAELLHGLIAALAEDRGARIPAGLDAQLALLLDLLARQRCLLVLDNCESLFQPGARASVFRPGGEPYGQLFRRLATGDHQSCVLLTSREPPPGFDLLRAESPQVRLLALAGLSADACHGLLRDRGLRVSPERAVVLSRRYSGSPLALQIVIETIKDLFGGDLEAFLAAGALIFDDIRDVLDQQWARLTALEQAVLFWLAVERDPVPLATLRADLISGGAGPALIEALHSLLRRSLIEPRGEAFTLPHVVTEYVTLRLVGAVADELTQGRWQHFVSHALIQAQAKESVRASQTRLILAPLAAEVVARMGREGLARQLRAGLDDLRARAPRAPGYAGGNALNLLVHLDYDLSSFDFSQLSVWQASLQLAQLQRTRFADADLSGSVFNDAFRGQNALAWSPDGRLLAAAAGDGAVCLWRLADRQLVGVCRGGAGYAYALAFSPDSARLACAGTDPMVRVWDVRSCQPLALLAGHRNTVYALVWASDGATLYSGSADHTIRAWRLSDGRASIIGTDVDEVHALAIRADGAALVSGGLAGQVLRWDLAARPGDACAPTQRLDHGGAIYALAISADGMLASGGFAGVRVWDGQRGVALTGLLPPGQPVGTVDLDFSPDGAWLAVAGEPGLRVWGTRTWRLRAALYGEAQTTQRVVWSPDGSRLASLGGDLIHIWELQTGQVVTTLRGHSDEVLSVTFSPDGQRAASSHVDARICIWDVARWQVRQVLRGHEGWTRDVRFHPDGATLVSASFDQTVRLWDPHSGRQLRALRGHAGWIDCLTLSRDGSRLATGSYDRSVWLWEAASGQVTHVLSGHTGTVAGLAFSPDGSVLASSAVDTTIRLWRVDTGAPLAVLTGHRNIVCDLRFDHSGRTLISGGYDQQIMLWDVARGQHLRTLAGHTSIVCELDLSPDGRTLASCGAGDQTVRLWDLASGAARHVLEHGVWVVTINFSPDGRTLISGGEDGRLRLWDVATGALLRVLRAPGPYAGMDISGATGITDAQRAGLWALGAVER
jgi:WD40 repeat protein/DNA-binding SARP family transcriptional activator